MRQREDVKKANAKRIAWGIVMFFLLQIAGALVVAPFALGYYAIAGHSDAQVSAWLLAAAVLLGYVFVIRFFLKRRWTAIRWSPIARADRLALCLLTVAMTIGFALPETYASELLNLNDDLSGMFSLLSHNVLGTLAISIIGPIGEELVFRGVVLKGLLRLSRRPWVAIVGSALIFGLVHMNPVQVFGASLMGLVMGWLYVRTGSLMPGIVMHVANNSLSTALMLAFGDDFLLTQSIPSVGLNVALCLAGCLLFAATIRTLDRRLARRIYI